ncbi:cytosine/adenosine deaminase-related metal-dependent hydrolase [Luteibacter sp. Sphag1AF]|uniref:amidohydrolase family protein n=1 Tax=Luteibacter sp. Sphag1AF TaxID=2587031 RepID=UPI0017D282A7|nr:amidohydrolase family protein [Luteibacter sp. Sphag1AF]MBB3228219.1 cytosine/adenosine deaminase-related metal-dependent hydrolase [Luteibacter sp. Sphag1AF]
MKLTRRSFLSSSIAAAATMATGNALSFFKDTGADHRGISTPSVPTDGRPILIQGATILSMDSKTGDFESGDILIEGSKISRISRSITAPGAHVIDGRGRIAIPGFVDTHRHAWEGQLRRINPNSADLMNYIAGTHGSFATKYRPGDMYVGNLITALGAIDAGITTIIDNSHNSRSLDHARSAVDALTDAGIRAVHAPGAPLAGSWDKDRWYDDLAKLKAERFSGKDGLLTMAMMTSPDRDQWAVGRKLGLPLVTEFFGKEMSAMLPAFLRDGLLGPDNIFNHCTDLTEEAWQIIRKAGVQVDVCPRSDTHWALGGGMFGYQAAIDHGIKPGFSVDNESAYSGDMFAEMRAALYLQRSAGQAQRVAKDPHAPAPVRMRELLEAATINGAAVAHLDKITGSLTEGKQADLVLINTNDINLYPSNNALGTVVGAAERSNVETVIIGGRVRKHGGKLVGLDMAKLHRATEESRAYLFKSVGYDKGVLAEDFGLRQ